VKTGSPKAQSVTESLPAVFRLAAAFLAAYLVVPFVLVFIVSGVDSEAFVCRVEVEKRLGETLRGKLEFLLVDVLEGRSPGKEVVIALDHGYTQGLAPAPTAGDGSAARKVSEMPVGSVFGIEGTLMTRDVFYGEQYLFFDGHPQIYAGQLRQGPLWPSQISRLKALYLSPFVSLVSLYWVWVSPFGEEFSFGSWLLVIARFLLICATAATVLILRRRRRVPTPGIIWATGVYVIVTIGLAVPSL
jgi:hypothetical protein